MRGGARAKQNGWSLTPLDFLLLAVPFAIALRYVPAWRNDTLLFIISAIAIVPLAGWMGRATEQLAVRSGAGVGGFLNATFGNAAELIIALVALSKGLTGVVKASITGSIIGNLLLVLGASILVGGVRYQKQTFNQTAARISATSLGLGAIALITPTIFHRAAASRPRRMVVGSRTATFAGHRPRAFPHLFLLALFSSLYPSRAFRRSVRPAGKRSAGGRFGNPSPL